MKSEEHSVRVQFEIGHEASLKSKKTQEGFTHDWEVFVRGADNTEIQYFVDKVVFHLHETFPRPKRVVKEPPYSVKESGYAGFILPIDVYLRNKEEPKKIKFNYDLNLQTSGPPISRVLREPRVFQNPSEDFRRRLIRGGGVGVDTPSDDIKQSKTPVKKLKPELPLTNSFADLFGTPIRRVTPEPKKSEPVKKVDGNNSSTNSSTPANNKKQDKHSGRKEKEKEKQADKSKERSKEKIKQRPSSPPGPPPSVIKTRPPSPPPPVVKQKDDHKKHDERKHEKNKDDKKHSKEEKQEEEIRKEKSDIVKDKDIVRKETKSHERETEKEKSEKHKRKHKKKEKEREKEKEKQKKEEVKEKEKKRKHEESVKEKSRKKSRSISPVVVDKSKKKPLNTLLEDVNSLYSASSMSEDEESVSSSTTKVPEHKPLINVNSKLKSTNLNSSNEDTNKKPDSSKHKKKNKKVEEKKKRRDKSGSSEREEEKVVKKEQEEKEKVVMVVVEKDVEKGRKEKKHKRDKIDKTNDETQSVKKKEVPSQSSEVESSKCDKFTKEYVAQLRDLQHRIMTLEDTSELQKVVQVIAETGLYEITKKTFDFDLCDLDTSTVKKLQDFFAMS